jgi:putative intracellular protease/amidase
VGVAPSPKTLKVLFVLTSHSELGETGEKTGLWLEELAAPFYSLLNDKVEITLASPLGGQAPIDPRSLEETNLSNSAKRFRSDLSAQQMLSNTQKLAQIKAEDYDGVFYPGGHGPLWDLAENETSIALIEAFIAQNKPMAFVCHAPAALKEVENSEGKPFIQGKKVTGFSNAEEKAVELINVVPFLLEDMLKEKGANYIKKDNWLVHVVTDGNLITGQNPSSSQLAAEKLFAKMK